MVMAAVFAVFAPYALKHAVAVQVAFIVFVAHAAGVFCTVFGKFVGVDKAVVAGVVGWVDVNHLHVAGIGFLQNFQRFEVFGFDKQILRALEIHRFGYAWRKRVGCGGLQGVIGGRFACPVELVAFVFAAEIVFTQNQLEFFPVDFFFAKHFR